MGTVTAQSIVDRAASQLLDEANVSWTQAELLAALNEGQRQIVLWNKEAYVLVEAMRLSPGTQQTLPAGGVEFQRVIRNMGASGTTAGRAVTPAAFMDLDVENPDWHSATANGVVRHWLFDKEMPKHFWVYPPQPSTPHYVEVAYTGTPDDVAISGTIVLDDLYANILFEFVMYRALSRESINNPVHQSKADKHLGMCLTSLGMSEVQQGEAKQA